MPPTDTIAIVIAVFLFGGFVKGLVGLGLPSITLALMTVTIGLKPAMALMLGPSIATNVLQALTGGHFLTLLRRFWPMLVPAVICVFLGSNIFARADGVWLAVILGVALVIHSTFNLAKLRLPHPGSNEPWLTPLVGAATGFIMGLSGSFIVPAVLYLEGLGLKRDQLVQSMGIAFTTGLLSLLAAMWYHGLFTAQLGAMSLGAILPSLAGMWLGMHVRQRLSEEKFRRVFFIALLLLGLYLTLRPLWI